MFRLNDFRFWSPFDLMKLCKRHEIGISVSFYENVIDFSVCKKVWKMPMLLCRKQIYKLQKTQSHIPSFHLFVDFINRFDALCCVLTFITRFSAMYIHIFTMRIYSHWISFSVSKRKRKKKQPNPKLHQLFVSHFQQFEPWGKHMPWQMLKTVCICFTFQVDHKQQNLNEIFRIHVNWVIVVCVICVYCHCQHVVQPLS